jgi:hypothetical protein
MDPEGMIGLVSAHWAGLYKGPPLVPNINYRRPNAVL